jgi:hypothetical protein
MRCIFFNAGWLAVSNDNFLDIGNYFKFSYAVALSRRHTLPDNFLHLSGFAELWRNAAPRKITPSFTRGK